MSTTIKNPDDLPEKPGVYLLKDVQENILYVGKARSLKKRVKSYFKEEIDDPKTRVLMRHFHHMDYMVTDTEKEALILESNLIKKHLPRYNIRLKDDKRYPYIKITSEDYPRLLITRRVLEDDSQYFGPFTDVTSVRSILKLLKPVFRLRDCKRMDGPCLNFQIDLCPAPCKGQVSKEEYLENVDKVRLFLEGKHQEVLDLLRKEMDQAALNHDYEKAAVIRDQLFSLGEVMEKQKMELNRNLDQDVVSLASDNELVVVVVFRVREGKIMGKEDFLMEGAEDNSPSKILTAFIKQYYSGPRQIPSEILLPVMIEDENLIVKWLDDNRKIHSDNDEMISNKIPDDNSTRDKTIIPYDGKLQKEHPKKLPKVSLRVPEKGLEQRLLQMVTKNAHIIINHHKHSRKALLELKNSLKIPRIPRRIEAFDVSNLGGKMAVASMVVFEDGKPRKKDYRKYKLKTPGPDDYGMMREVLTRRYKKLVNKGETPPDLIVVDGGRGQLNIATKVLESLNIKTGVIGLAKEFEQVFIPEVPLPIILPPKSPALHLLQRVRDEAHRFAVKYHKNLRHKELTSSPLDEIPGIGPKRKINLLKHFGDLESIIDASIDEIASVNGINRNLAADIYDFFHKDEV
ncbi:MAG: excinuclease ABC subunit C [Methanobacteriaceae archaeon]|nr:excinuclease ABC subunit C [Methanobacteriaceae archaeon]